MIAIRPSAHPEDVTLLSARALTALYARGELSPVEVVKRTLERIEALNDTLRMFIWTAPQAALAAAREAEAAYRRGIDVAPLAGVPFSVKDTLAVQGAPLTFGSALFAAQAAQTDSPAVERLRSAGAVFVGMTNMPEFGHRPTNENAHYGTARNPWDTARTPGGSSGGSAAAVATGASVLSIGTDAGGSVRIPASCCGVLGIKATHGLVPSADALDAFGSLVQIGPLARTVSDLAWSLDVMAGRHDSDPWSYAVPRQQLRAAACADGDLRALRIAWLPYLAAGEGAEGLDAQVRALCEQALQRLTGLGAVLTWRQADLSASSPILAAIAGALNQHRYGPLLREHGEALPASFRTRVQAAAELTRE
ncbi:MAG TPA: amidase, partial [Plasticicumulans sp.]|nr:amidase [Plasticicumulans sp.]